MAHDLESDHREVSCLSFIGSRSHTQLVLVIYDFVGTYTFSSLPWLSQKDSYHYKNSTQSDDYQTVCRNSRRQKLIKIPLATSADIPVK